MVVDRIQLRSSCHLGEEMKDCYSYFSLDTLLLTGDSVSNTRSPPDRPGYGVVKGLHDHLSVRVALVVDDFGDAVPVIVDTPPPAPASTEWRTWAWNTVAHRWVAEPTLALLKQRAAEPLLQQLDALDSKARRPTGEITQSMALGEAVPAEALARLQSITADKAGLRQHLAAIAASTSAAELATITASPPDTGLAS